MICYFNSGAIGEFLMTLYFSDVVKDAAAGKSLPAPTTFVAVRRNAALLTELAKYYPHVRVVSLEKGHLFIGIRTLCSQKLQQVITQQTFGRLPLRIKTVAWLCARITGASLVGFDDTAPYNGLLYDRLWRFDATVLFPTEMCRLAARIGYEGRCPQPALRWEGLRGIRGTHFVFHLRAFTPNRSLPMARWKSLIMDIRERWPDRTFIFTGSSSDKEFIAGAIEGIPNCENRAGQLPLPRLIETLDSAAVFIGVDTGITHLAAFRSVPSVILGNRSNPCWWATYSPKTQWLTEPRRCTCRGDKRGDCEDSVDGAYYFRCLLDVSTGSVIKALEDVVQSAP